MQSRAAWRPIRVVARPREVAFAVAGLADQHDLAVGLHTTLLAASF